MREMTTAAGCGASVGKLALAVRSAGEASSWNVVLLTSLSDRGSTGRERHPSLDWRHVQLAVSSISSITPAAIHRRGNCIHKRAIIRQKINQKVSVERTMAGRGRRRVKLPGESARRGASTRDKWRARMTSVVSGNERWCRRVQSRRRMALTAVVKLRSDPTGVASSKERRSFG